MIQPSASEYNYKFLIGAGAMFALAVVSHWIGFWNARCI